MTNPENNISIEGPINLTKDPLRLTVSPRWGSVVFLYLLTIETYDF